jgi:hypothetical protein
MKREGFIDSAIVMWQVVQIELASVPGAGFDKISGDTKQPISIQLEKRHPRMLI